MGDGGFSVGAGLFRFLDRLVRVLAIIVVIVLVYVFGSGQLAGLVASCLPISRDRGGVVPPSMIGSGLRHTGGASSSRISLGGGQFDFQMQNSSLPPAVFADQWLEEQLLQGATPFALPQQFQILEAMNIQKMVAVHTTGGVLRLLFSRMSSSLGSSNNQIEFNLNDLSKMAGQDLARGDFGSVNTASYGDISEVLLGTCKVAWDSPLENGGRNLVFATEVSGMLPEAALVEAERVLRGGGFQAMPPVSTRFSLPRTIIAFREQRHCQVQATEYQGITTLIYRFE